MNEAFEKYLFSLRQDRDDKTELSDRGALETLLNAAGKDADPKIRIIHGGERGSRQGRPGFQGDEGRHDPRLCREQDHRRKGRKL